MANFDQRRTRLPIAREEPVSLAPPSSVGKAWTPRGVGYACGAVAAAVAVIAGALAPLLVKPDYTGWVKEDRLKACETRLDERDKAHEKGLDDERERTGKCYQKLGDCLSQTGAQGQVIESLETKRKRR